MSNTNNHPAVMFEIMALNQQNLCRFYSHVFGWTFQKQANGFMLIQFPQASQMLLGGIGSAITNQLGYQKGTAFYLSVPDVGVWLQKVQQNGGTVAVPVTSLPGFTFGMFYDPENNLVGLLQQTS